MDASDSFTLRTHLVAGGLPASNLQESATVSHFGRFQPRLILMRPCHTLPPAWCLDLGPQVDSRPVAPAHSDAPLPHFATPMVLGPGATGKTAQREKREEPQNESSSSKGEIGGNTNEPFIHGTNKRDESFGQCKGTVHRNRNTSSAPYSMKAPRAGCRLTGVFAHSGRSEAWKKNDSMRCGRMCFCFRASSCQTGTGICVTVSFSILSALLACPRAPI